MKPEQNRAEQFIEGLLDFSKGRIIFKEDVDRIIIIAFDSGNEEILKELLFEAKYITGLMKIIRNKDFASDTEYFNKIGGEYKEHLEKFTILFRRLLEPATGFIKEIFEKKFFGMTRESLEHLNNLCGDLGIIKSYLNQLNEERKGF